MNKLLLVTVLVLFASAITVFASSQNRSIYDHFDLDAVFSNERILRNYLNCLLVENAPCTKEGRNFRDDIPKALKSSCSNCSSSQRKFARKAIRWIIKNKPVDWELLKAKYDPKNQYGDAFRKFINSDD